MANKYLDDVGLTHLWAKIKGHLNNKLTTVLVETEFTTTVDDLYNILINVLGLSSGSYISTVASLSGYTTGTWFIKAFQLQGNSYRFEVVEIDSGKFITVGGGYPGTTALRNIEWNSYLPLTGGIVTGAIERNYASASTEPVLKIGSSNQDINIFKVYDYATGQSAGQTTKSVYGYNLMYNGTGDGVANALTLYCDNQNSATQAIGWQLNQAGQMGIGTNASTSYRLTVNGAANATTLYENGTSLANKYASKTAVATSSALGLVKSSTTGTTANRDYNVEVKSDGTMKVNVPWVNTLPSADAADIVYWETTPGYQLVTDLLGLFQTNGENAISRSPTSYESNFFGSLLSQIRAGRKIAGIYIYNDTTVSGSQLIAYLQLSLVNGNTITFTVYNLEFASEPTYGYIVEWTNGGNIFIAKTRLVTQTDLNGYLTSDDLDGYVTGTDLTSGNVIVGDGNGAIKDSEWSLLTLIAAAEGATDTYVINSKAEGLTLAPSSIVTQPDSSTKAIAITEIKTNTDATIPISSLKLGDIVLSIATDEPDYFVAAVYSNYIMLAELETRKIDLSSYTIGASSSTDNAMVRFDGTTGKIIQNSKNTIDDSGNMVINDGATIKLSLYGNRYLNISGNSILADMSNVSGGWAGAFASVKDPSGTTTTMLGWYGGSSLTHIYMGGAYNDPYMKMTAAGLFTFKNQVTVNAAQGTAPFKVTSTTVNTNLNADLLDGKHASDFALSSAIGNGTLTIQKNGTNVTTFTANQSGNTTANITVPTKVSELTNDSGFISSYTDTKNTTGSTNDEAKLYLVGAKSQAANPQTFSDAEVYTQAGELNATSMCVAEHGQIKYDSTNKCIRFVIV